MRTTSEQQQNKKSENFYILYFIKKMKNVRTVLALQYHVLYSMYVSYKVYDPGNIFETDMMFLSLPQCSGTPEVVPPPPSAVFTVSRFTRLGEGVK